MSAIDFDLLEKQYFYFDKPVPYKLDEDKIIYIKPINVEDSEIFLSSSFVITIDKDSIPDPKIIQMSYLQFIIESLFQANEASVQALVNICKICLGIEHLGLVKNKVGRICLIDQITGDIINPKQFDDIRKIILKQNFVDYDDEYIHPDLKKALDETKRLKNKNLDMPNIERKMAIITAHCGLSKQEQLKMTYRSHSLLFIEICGEVEYTTVMPIALLGNKSSEIEHWIFKKKKGKFEEGVISVSDYSKSIGGDGNTNIHQNSIPEGINKYL